VAVGGLREQQQRAQDVQAVAEPGWYVSRAQAHNVQPTSHSLLAHRLLLALQDQAVMGRGWRGRGQRVASRRPGDALLPCRQAPSCL
jgi:hypothetical protein